MNKKFTLLFAAAMLSSSLVNSMLAENLTTTLSLNDAKSNVYYALRASHLHNGTNAWNSESQSYYVVAKDGKFYREVVSNETLDNNVWKVTASSATANGTVYTFESKDKKVLKVSTITGFALRSTGATHENATVYGLNLNLTDYVATAGTELVSSTTANAKGLGFVLESLSVKDVTAKELNSIQGGDGLIFAYPSETAAVTGDILTGVQLVAIEVPTDAKNGEVTIPAGVYFATKVSDKLQLTKDGKLDVTTDKVKAQVAAFLASEFIAVNPSDYNETTGWTRGNCEGFGLKKVAGSDFSYDTSKATKGSSVSIMNACFTVNEPDAYTTTDQYTLSVKANLEVEAGKDHVAKDVNLAVKQANSVSYLVTTTGEGQKFKTQASATSALIDATTLLNSDKTPAIYAIKVLSGDAKDQYLTNGKYTLPSVDVNDPTNQYVITSVKNNVVTFKSRVNSDVVKMSFYGDNADLTFKVVAVNDDAKINYAKSEESTQISFAETNLNAETVELIKVTPKSKFDSFLNRDEKDYSLVSFKVAPNAVTDRYVNINVPVNETTGAVETGKMLYDADEAAKFMLVNKKYEETADYNTVSDFAYLKGEEVAFAKDTVAYPTYQIKAYEAANFDKPNEGKFIGDSYELKNGNTGALDFIVKENADGSVYLISEASSNYYVATWQGMTTDAKVGNEATQYTATNYATILNKANKVYMSGDEASVSLEAKSQHVSMMETVAGSYVLADTNNDAIVKGVDASAAVLWLDTTKTEAEIPTFYISQGGKFLFNATDSTSTTTTDYKVPGASDEVKLIFKKAELVGSDTLKTTVNGVEVMVADKANKLQNVVAGVENFQYQILKAKEDNEYVIRQGAKYVKTTNGYLTLTASEDQAMHVVVESQAAPTSNENVVVASEVKVVAQDGAVVVKNAAGKNVVVSTILGQVVANEVLTSDNATINVPAGIVVVAVEGESFKVNVK